MHRTALPTITTRQPPRRRLRLLGLILAAALTLALSPAAHADQVLLMHPDGRVSRVENRFVSGAAKPQPKPKPKPKAESAPVSVSGLLPRLVKQGTPYLREWNAALSTQKHLSGTRAAELGDVISLVKGLAAKGQLTANRLPVLFLTLARNTQWWKSGALPSPGQRIQFSGSQLVWQYYPGQGLQLQVLGTFGEANGLYEAGPASYPKLTALLAEMTPLAVHRGGGLAWEYYFNFDGGRPPWVSAMSQATGIEAFTNAYQATHNRSYLNTAHQALGILQTAPPDGVEVKSPSGVRFLQYSFQPRNEIINAFLQTLIGLNTYAQVSGDPVAQRLFAAGNSQAQADLPAFNTGSWSLYQPGEEDPLNYHQLVTGFLQTLCKQTGAAPYCNTAQAFAADLSAPPKLALTTTRAAKQKPFHLRFKLNKPAHVGVILASTKSHKTYLSTSSESSPGTDFWQTPKLPAGTYTVELSATDQAGNHASISPTLTVK
ncbi:MAG: hypothetical protein J2O48_03640 [Solirubrobacterales bacterium]|nr:hypothetical protein [Solirubrobacterales bacterium]